MTLLWMSRDQAAECLDRRISFLETCQHDDLATIARAYGDRHPADYDSIGGFRQPGPEQAALYRSQLVKS